MPTESRTFIIYVVRGHLWLIKIHSATVLISETTTLGYRPVFANLPIDLHAD